MRSPLVCPIVFVFLLATLTSCVGRQAYYVSPFNGLNNPYHTIPSLADSTRSAFYANGSLGWGSTNDFGRDRSFAGNINLSHSLNLGAFQAFYAAGVSSGFYQVDTFAKAGNNDTVNPDIINAAAGKKRFTGVGFDGGINLVMPIQNGEWRVIGIETSVRKEWGSYHDFRKALPDSAATVVVRSDTYGTVGGYTEFLAYKGQTTYGFKAGVGTVVGENYKTRSITDSDIGLQNIIYNYFDLTAHLSHGKWTGYFQYNDATKASAFLVGANYRLGK